MRVLTLILISFATLPIGSVYSKTDPAAISQAVPEAFTGMEYKKAHIAKDAMIAAANPHAVEAGQQMLALGGNAIDAAIAVQLVLTLVEPQSSGIGGGAFLMWFDGKSKQISTFDGRETAPSAATPELFFENGKPVKWIDAVIGGRSVGVPGVLHMLHKVHQSKGKLPWKQLFQPAIDLANNGFFVSPRLAKLVAMKMNPGLAQLSPAKSYFYPNGKAIEEGQLLVNKEYGQTLTIIAEQGIEAFYQGVIAKKIVNAVQGADKAPGGLTLDDLKRYQSKTRPPVCLPYDTDQSHYEVCSMGPPSSGGITVLQILAILSTFDLTSHSYDSPQTLHLYAQAARLAFADRDRYLADSDFVDVPVTALLDRDYLQQRAALISKTKDLGKAIAGNPLAIMQADNESIEQPNTSHISIVDQFGNALSMTTSIEMGFGSTVMAGGFLLNNQLTDFSLIPSKNGKPIANRVQANKRPRSSMTPVIVLKDGEVFAVLGSPGGSRIINYVGYALIGLLEYGLDIEDVVNGPRFSNRNSYTAVERNSSIEQHKAALEALGHHVRVTDMTSGIHAVIATPTGWKGVADPRREGSARGLDRN